MNKAWLQVIPGLLLLAAMLAKVRDAFKFEVPVGYQDENGFHYGTPPAKKETIWPPFE